MWSVGCILGELITGKAIFPGKSTINQIELILDLLGRPTPEDIESMGATSDYAILNSLPGK
jgi:mitogen-activated protein kinase 15